MRIVGANISRCHRLTKDCQPASFVRKRGSRKVMGRKSQLEDKLDNIVSLLQAQNAPKPTAPVIVPLPAPNLVSGFITCPPSRTLHLLKHLLSYVEYHSDAWRQPSGLYINTFFQIRPTDF